METTMDGRAVVIGGGMAGLAAARVLSRRYPDVTLLDRDELPAGGEPRRGVPQGNHGHILLVSGMRELTGLFPGLPDELAAAGASRFDTGSGLCVFRFGQRWPAVPTGIDLVSVSRPLLEAVIRGRVIAEPAVTVRSGVAVTALAGTARAVTGVVLDTGETLPADLVVDCSGRGARSDRWLGALGLPAPAQVEVKVGVAYTTRVYRRTPGELEGRSAALILPDSPRENRVGLVLPIEDERWLVSVGGWHVDEVPQDDETFTAYARSLPDPILADLIERAEPLSEPLSYRFPSSRRRRFEDLHRVPAGYVAVGDAICSFNPIYGQGMSCAVRQAVALGAVLDRHGAVTAALARDFYAEAAAVIAVPWQFAVGGDFVYPQTTGPRPRGVALSNWYARRLSRASRRDPELNRLFVSVQQLIETPDALLRPAVVAKVLAKGRRR